MMVRLLQRGDYRPHRFTKPRPLWTLGANAPGAPPPPRTAGALRSLVRRRPPCHTHEGLHSIVQRADLAADGLGFGHATGLAGLAQVRAPAPQRAPQDAATRQGAGASADRRPPGQPLARLRSPRFPTLLSAAPALAPRFTVPPQ